MYDNNNNNNNNPIMKPFRLNYIELRSKEPLISTICVQCSSCLFKFRRSPFGFHHPTCLCNAPITPDHYGPLSPQYEVEVLFLSSVFLRFCTSVLWFPRGPLLPLQHCQTAQRPYHSSMRCPFQKTSCFRDFCSIHHTFGSLVDYAQPSRICVPR